MIAPLIPLRERYDAVLLDLDGTLLDGTSSLTPGAVSAVRALVDAGLLVSICTGRSVIGSAPIHAALGLDDVLVAYNGGWIGRPNGEVWRRASIPDDHVSAIERADAHAEFSFWHNGDAKYTVRGDHPLHARVTDWYTAAVVLPSSDGLPRRDLMRVSWFFEDETPLERAWLALGSDAHAVLHRETFPMSVFPEFRESRLHLTEIQVRSRGKAEAFAYLEAEHGIPASRVIAVGDHLNDLSMLDGAGLAVVMGNGEPRAKACADLVIGRHDEEGLARWVEAGCPVPTEGDER